MCVVKLEYNVCNWFLQIYFILYIFKLLLVQKDYKRWIFIYM